MRTPIAIALVPLAACFGEGPTPKAAPGTVVVYRAPAADPQDPCNTSQYIGAVTFLNDNGYAIPLPYSPNNVQGGCQGSPQPRQLSVWTFPKSGMQPDGMILGQGGAGTYTQGGGRPSLAQNGQTFRFAYQNGGAIEIAPDQAALTTSTGIGNAPLSLAFDDTRVFVAIMLPNTGTVDPFSPPYPCCGGNGGGASSGYIYALPLPLPASSNPTPLGGSQPRSLFCDEVDHCIALTPTGVAYLEHAGPSIVAQIRVIAKDGSGSPVNLGDTGSIVSQGAVPVGLQADPTRVVSSFAMSALAGNKVPPGCWIFASDLAAPGTARLVLGTSRWSCMDARLDGDDIYFTIIGSDVCENCGGNSALHGLGIGRVSISDPSQFESIAIGVSGFGAGPRRLRVDSDFIFAIDPLVVARIAKTDLNGQHDFAP
jgi:hypothetical protein